MNDMTVFVKIDGIRYQYTHVCYHRNRNPQKSQWDIDFEEEISIYKTAFENLWREKGRAWGILKNGDSIKIVGKTIKKEVTKIGVFIGSDIRWHGYPGDYRGNIKDRPNAEVLNVWVKEQYITKRLMAKILQGQKCEL